MSQASEPKPGWRLRPVMLLPLVLFAGLAALFLARLELQTGPDVVPSVLIGKPAPDFALPALAGAGVPGLARADLDGHLTLVNIFASWCVPCRQEHPVLERIATDSRIRLVGIDYKDKPENALALLSDQGNPYAAIGVDERAHLHRLGRLWRAGDLSGRGRRHHRQEIYRPAHRRDGGQGPLAGNRQDAGQGRRHLTGGWRRPYRNSPPPETASPFRPPLKGNYHLD